MKEDPGNPAQGASEEAKTVPEHPKPVELTDKELDSVSGGSGPTLLSNIANMKHESLKAIAQNLRG